MKSSYHSLVIIAMKKTKEVNVSCVAVWLKFSIAYSDKKNGFWERLLWSDGKRTLA